MIPPELETRRLVIRPYKQSDEDRYVEMVLDENTLEFMGGATGLENEERKVFKKIFEIYKADEKRTFWIWGIYNGDVLIGHLELKETEHTKENELEIVYLVHPGYRNNGVMTEILSFIKGNQNIWNKRIIATVNPDNFASLKLLQKWGIANTEVLMDHETKEEYLKLSLNK